jgi:glutamyl-tRNA synthetase
VALTGTAASPGIFDVLELLGRERSLARIDAALAHPQLAPAA